MWTILNHQLINLEAVQKIEIFRDETLDVAKIILFFIGGSNEDSTFVFTSNKHTIQSEYERLIRLLIKVIK